MIHEKIEIHLKDSEFTANLFTYFLDNSPEIDPERKRPVVLICPGGGYAMTSDREAEALAVKFMAMGYHAAILRYSVAPARFPEALLQLATAVAMLRENADKWNIDTEKIVVQGSSAGGHLAASLGVFWNKPFVAEALEMDAEKFCPNGLMLSYPVITSGEKAHQGSFESVLGEDYADEEKLRFLSLEFNVTKDTPPTFMWHTAPDDTVPVENSLLFFQALHALDIPAELHIYPVGGHGLGLATAETSCPNGYGIQAECETWVQLAGDWMKHTFEAKEIMKAQWEEGGTDERECKNSTPCLSFFTYQLRYENSLNIQFRRLIHSVGNIFPVFLTLPDAFSKQILDLAVDGAEIIFCPGGNLIIKLCRKPERNLFLWSGISH